MMTRYITIVLLIACISGLNSIYAQKNPAKPGAPQLAPTPPMGFNTWNTFQTNINEDMLKAMVDSFVSSGMQAAGYEYFVLDDGWMSMERDSLGSLTPDPAKFPHGMKAFADYVHAKGMKFGIYNCAGNKTCGGYPGTRGHEFEDARLYASWGVDFLKYDWCNTDSLNAPEAYKTMHAALLATGRPIVFSLCEWGQHAPWLWAGGVGELYRTTGDIKASFVNNVHMGTWEGLSVISILDKQQAIRQYNGPSHWNDPDMLEVGNGMSATEDKSHFSLWCMMAAPLAAGNDLRKMSEVTRRILTNKQMIAIDQDERGIAAFKMPMMDSLELYIKPLKNNGYALCFFNRTASTRKFEFNWKDLHISDTLSHTDIQFNKEQLNIRNLWSPEYSGTTLGRFKYEIASHDVIVLKLQQLVH